MTPTEAHRILSKRGWLSTRPPELRAALLAVSETRTLSAGTMLYAIDEPPGGLYGIAEGFVDVLIAPGAFPLRLVHVGRVGWWVGEAAAATGTPRRAEVKSRTPATVVYIPAKAIGQLAAEESRLWGHLASLTVHHLDTAITLAALLASDDLNLRVLAALDQLVGPWAEPIETVALPIGQAELAEITGLSRTTLVRVLSSLDHDGCIQRQYRSINVKVPRLREMLLRRGRF